MIEFGLAACASAAWGASDFAAGLAARRQPVVVVLAAAQCTGLALAVSVVLLTGPAMPAAAAMVTAACAGVFEALGFAALYAALARGPMSVVAPVAGLGAMVPLFGGLVGGDQLGVVAFVGCLGAVSAVALVAGGQGDPSTGRILPGVALALASAGCFGLFSMLIDHAASEAPFVWAVAVARGVAVLLVLPALVWCVTRRSTRIRSLSGFREPATLVLVGVLDVSANLFFAWGASHDDGPLVAVVGSTYPVFTVLLAAGLLGERLAVSQRAGVMLALAATALITL